MKFCATCKMGLESVVGDELIALGIEGVKKEDARVFFEGSFSDMATACIWLRAAERVLFVVGEFTATTFSELFDGVRDLELKQYFARDSFIHVNGSSAKSTLFSVSDCQSIVKKAIVENLKAAFKVRTLPETGREVIIEVRILNDNVTLVLDPCGAGLSRRGYRLHNYDAPIAETLGAGILLISRYDGQKPFIDPMCGSGTLPIEAAMIAKNIAPGLNREFAGESWRFIDRDLFANIKAAARDAIKDVKPMIKGIDISERAIYISKQHAKNAGIMVDWAVAPISELTAFPNEERGIIAVNPPYGERMMKPKEIVALYGEIRRAFDRLPERWSKNIITSYLDFERVYGRRADKRRNLSNGGKRCTLYSYFRKKT